MEEVNKSSFIFDKCTTFSSHRTEAFPEERFADVCSNEKRNTTTNSITFLHHFIKHDDNNSRESKLEDNENPVSSTDFLKGTVHS